MSATLAAALQALLDDGKRVALGVHAAGATGLPLRLRSQYTIRLDVEYGVTHMPSDVQISPLHVSGTFSFDGIPHRVYLPWSCIHWYQDQALFGEHAGAGQPVGVISTRGRLATNACEYVPDSTNYAPESEPYDWTWRPAPDPNAPEGAGNVVRVDFQRRRRLP